MPSKVFSASPVGLSGQIIEIETDVHYGLRCFNIVGLPDKSVEESKERVGSAIKSSRFQSPFQQPERVLVNLAPADLKKEGALYDLPIALGYLSASEQIKFNPKGKVIIGELSLDGTLRPTKGILPLALAATEQNMEEIILPKANAAEASLVLAKNAPNEKSFRIIAVNSLIEAINYLEGKIAIVPFSPGPEIFSEKPRYATDLGWIKGQESAKRALEIAAAGGHNILMQGPPGSGKSLLANSLPSILPELSFSESLEVTKIYSIAGLLPEKNPLIKFRPFRAPHHTTSEVALIGGGNPPKPGEITLSHRGVLFLDEFPEFHRDVLESLRQPLEEGTISILRAGSHLTFPSRFILAAAANPCPCGYYKNPERHCKCLASQISMYRRKLSGPLIDRIDIFIDVPNLTFEKLTSMDEDNSSEKIKERVESARRIQMERFKEDKILINSEMQIPQIKKYCQIEPRSQGVLKQYVDSGKLSARGYHRVLKIARTIADLANSEKISCDNMSEALMYRVRED